jgi:hypothetical protein
MWKHNGRTISVGRGWTADNGVQNPANWHIWSASEKVAAGVVEIVEETHKTLMVLLHLPLKLLKMLMKWMKMVRLS